MTKKLKSLLQNKQKTISRDIGAPGQKSGKDGDFHVRRILGQGIFLFYKWGNRWYSARMSQYRPKTAEHKQPVKLPLGVEPSSIGDLTLTSLAQAATAVPTDCRIVVFEEDIDAITINTDLKAYASRDGGTTYTEFVLVDEGDYATSKQIWAGSVDVSGQPSGSSMRWKIRGFGNSGDAKEFKLHGVCLTWGN